MAISRFFFCCCFMKGGVNEKGSNSVSSSSKEAWNLLFLFLFLFFLCLDGSTGSRALAKSENYLVSLRKVRFTKGISLPIYIGASRWMRLSSKIMRI